MNFILSLSCLVLFSIFYFTDKRRLINGFLFTLFLYSLLLDLMFLSLHSEHQSLVWISFFLLLILILIFPTLALGGGIFLMLQTPQLLRKEGRKFRNIVSFCTGLLFLAGLLLIAVYFLLVPWTWSKLPYFILFLSGCYGYLIFTFVCYSVSAWLYQFNHPLFNQDFLLILGCGIRDEKLTPLLQGRVDRALDFFWKQEKKQEKKKRRKKECMLICSGGQGRDEVIAEAIAIQRYCILQGVPEHRILVEAQSKNTFENFLFSKTIMDERKHRYKCLFCTSDYHVFRAGLLSKKVGIRHCSGLGSRTVGYYSINAFAREYIAAMKMYWKFHTCLILFCGLLLFLYAYIIRLN